MSKKFELNKINAINSILVLIAISFSAFADPVVLNSTRTKTVKLIPVVLKGARQRLKAIKSKKKWITVDLLV